MTPFIWGILIGFVSGAGSGIGICYWLAMEYQIEEEAARKAVSD